VTSPYSFVDGGVSSRRSFSSLLAMMRVALVGPHRHAGPFPRRPSSERLRRGVLLLRSQTMDAVVAQVPVDGSSGVFRVSKNSAATPWRSSASREPCDSGRNYPTCRASVMEIGEHGTLFEILWRGSREVAQRLRAGYPRWWRTCHSLYALLLTRVTQHYQTCVYSLQVMDQPE